MIYLMMYHLDFAFWGVLPAKNFDCDIVDTCFHASRVLVNTQPNKPGFLLYERKVEKTINQ